MALRYNFSKILNEYSSARTQTYAKHSLAGLIRVELPAEVSSVLKSLNFDGYETRGSHASQWVKSPWVAILEPSITNSPQRRFYPVYLFREDMTGFYLSLNQGMTEAKTDYGAGAKEALLGRAVDYRNRLGQIPPAFAETTIDLRPDSGSNDSAFYQAGNICAKFYDPAALPEEATFISDLGLMVDLYSRLANSLLGEVGPEDDEHDNPFIEDLTAFKFHKRIERDPTTSKKVKKIRGYVCEACNFNSEKAYPGLEKNKYIEAHHLVPVSKLKGTKAERDPKKDFVVLCANCHRMIHRSEHLDDLEAFKRTSGVQLFRS